MIKIHSTKPGGNHAARQLMRVATLEYYRDAPRTVPQMAAALRLPLTDAKRRTANAQTAGELDSHGRAGIWVRYQTSALGHERIRLGGARPTGLPVSQSVVIPTVARQWWEV